MVRPERGHRRSGGAEPGLTGQAEHQREAVEEQRRAGCAGHKITQAGCRRREATPRQDAQDIEVDREQFQGREERPHIGGGGPQHRAQRGQQEKARDRTGLTIPGEEVGTAGQQSEHGRRQYDDIDDDGKAVEEEGTVEDRDRLLELRRQPQERRDQGDQRDHRRGGTGPQPRDQEDDDRSGQQPEFGREREQVPESSHPPPRQSSVITEKLMLSIRIAGRTPSKTISDSSPMVLASSSVPRSRIRPSRSGIAPKKIRWTVTIIAPATTSTPNSASGVAMRWLG